MSYLPPATTVHTPGGHTTFAPSLHTDRVLEPRGTRFTSRRPKDQEENILRTGQECLRRPIVAHVAPGADNGNLYRGQRAVYQPVTGYNVSPGNHNGSFYLAQRSELQHAREIHVVPGRDSVSISLNQRPGVQYARGTPSHTGERKKHRNGLCAILLKIIRFLFCCCFKF
ncbi:hypothetical protein PHSC3_001212 [Chlamydiales bacterium STE3]|nr:hypothetical protein PHSC3_001212 [Chlamydiales bacterium STE3]